MMFMDTSQEDRDKRFLLSLTEEERKFVHDEAAKRGVHAAVLIRRMIRVCLMEKPDLFNLIQQ